jgi:preprotein translocase subunit SecB
MNANGLAKDPNAVDVSQPETHFQVQCSDIRLISSLLQPVELQEEDHEPSRFVFKIDGSIEGKTAYSTLDVEVVSINDDEDGDIHAYELRFLMLGVFTTETDIEPETFADFIRLYTLSILWPYAREYTSDQLRRAGQSFESLPIINPQMITEKLIEGGLIKINMISSEDETQKAD